MPLQKIPPPPNPFAVCEHPCPDERYFRDEGLNASTIKATVASLSPLSVVPAKGRAYRNQQRRDTPALVVGRAAHAFILEGEKVYAARFAVMPDVDRRTKAGKSMLAAWLLDNENKTGITVDQDFQVRGMAAAVRRCAAARRLLVNGLAERAIFWSDLGTGLPCKARLDYITEDGTLVDLKTCQDATESGFTRSVALFRYHIQASFYMRAYREFHGGDSPPFRFVAVEKIPPYSVGVCDLDEDTLAAADDVVGVAMRLWARGDEAPSDFGEYTVSLRPYQNHLALMEDA